VTIETYDDPVAVAGGDISEKVCSGDLPVTVDFSGSASGGKEPYTYDWDFGDGSSASDASDAGQTPSHDYDDAGEYTVTLTVTDDCGSTDIVEADIVVHSPCVLPEELNVWKRDSSWSGQNHYLRVKFYNGSGDINSYEWYFGWCAHSELIGLPYIPQELNVYCTLDPDLDLASYWPKINWIINNRNGYSKNEVQDAIWHYINGENVSGDAATLVSSADSQGDFCPAIGEKFVVLLTRREIDDDLYGGIYRSNREEQPILIEVERVDHCDL